MVRTYVTGVAKVEVNRRTGGIQLMHFWCTNDCGQMSNPDGMKAQVESNIIHTFCRTLKEELTFDRGSVTSLDWASYPATSFSEVPEIVVDLIDHPAEPPWGAGEPTTTIAPSSGSSAA